MLSIAKSNFERTGQPNRHAFHDTGQATMSLVIEATALGLAVHQMAGFSAEKADCFREGGFDGRDPREPLASV